MSLGTPNEVDSTMFDNNASTPEAAMTYWTFLTDVDIQSGTWTINVEVKVPPGKKKKGKLTFTKGTSNN